MADSRKKALELLQAGADKKFGKGSLMLLGDAPVASVEVVPTGSLGLDLALGVGGLPRGRIVEVYGPESSGKTTIALHVISEVQKLGGVAAFVDAEHALDVPYARALGVDTDHLFLNQPDNGEQGLEMVDMLVASDAIDVVVVDSVAALVPKAELEGEMGDAHMGLQARLMSQAMRKLTGAVARTKTLVIFTNQTRQKIGVIFGNPETTTGGNALKFYASVRLDVRRVGKVMPGGAKKAEGEDKGQSVGNRTRVKVVKNKLAPPFKETEFDLVWGVGIDLAGEVLDLGSELGVIEKSGAWYEYKGERLAQGRDNARAVLREKPEWLAALREEVLAAAKSPKGAAA